MRFFQVVWRIGFQITLSVWCICLSGSIVASQWVSRSVSESVYPNYPTNSNNSQTYHRKICKTTKHFFKKHIVLMNMIFQKKRFSFCRDTYKMFLCSDEDPAGKRKQFHVNVSCKKSSFPRLFDLDFRNNTNLSLDS